MLKKLRIEAGLTQKRLAELVGVSQAHIAKIEQGNVDPRLSTVNRVLKVLNEWKKKKCRDIMSHGVICAKLKDRILEVSDKMLRQGISQVPVINGNQVVGTVTEESIMRRLGSDVVNQTAEKVMVSPLPVVDEETDVEKVQSLLKTYQGVLVSRGKKIVGIITRSDLLKVICEPI
ncbi:MAG TPA: CBS domain-containing protein [Candidatus Bathyarchaeia archaeon]|nr:CBS domain-containing protein [Candidatus Bathyarchaeia archaeon]